MNNGEDARWTGGFQVRTKVLTTFLTPYEYPGFAAG